MAKKREHKLLPIIPPAVYWFGEDEEYSDEPEQKAAPEGGFFRIPENIDHMDPDALKEYFRNALNTMSPNPDVASDASAKIEQMLEEDEGNP